MACEDWWDLTETADTYKTICLKLIKDVQFRQLMFQAQKFEAIAVGIVQFYHLLALDQSTVDTKTSVNVYLKNLLYYIHQNFLLAAKFVSSRIADGGPVGNQWVDNLKKAVNAKLVKQPKNRNEAIQVLRVNVQNSDNLVRNIIRANARKQFFAVLHEFVNRMPLFSIEKIRDTLYNIEQFKFDAMLQPEISISSSLTP